MKKNDKVVIKSQVGPGRRWNEWQVEKINGDNVIIKRFISSKEFEDKKKFSADIKSPYSVEREDCYSAEYQKGETIKLTKKLKLNEVTVSKNGQEALIKLAALSFAREE